MESILDPMIAFTLAVVISCSLGTVVGIAIGRYLERELDRELDRVRWLHADASGARIPRHDPRLSVVLVPAACVPSVPEERVW